MTHQGEGRSGREAARRDHQAEADIRSERAIELAKLSDHLDQQGLGDFAASVRQMSRHNRIQSIEQQVAADALEGDSPKE